MISRVSVLRRIAVWISSSGGEVWALSSSSMYSINSSSYRLSVSSRPRRARVGFFDKLLGYVVESHVLAGSAFKRHSLHQHEINHARERIARAHRNLHRHGDMAQLAFQLSHHPRGIGAGAVHLVDESDSRYAIPLHLAVHCD